MFDAIFAPQRLLDELGDRAWLQAMLDAERALALAAAAEGVIPASAAEAIAAACRAELFESEHLRGRGRPRQPCTDDLHEESHILGNALSISSRLIERRRCPRPGRQGSQRARRR